MHNKCGVKLGSLRLLLYCRSKPILYSRAELVLRRGNLVHQTTATCCDSLIQPMYLLGHRALCPHSRPCPPALLGISSTVSQDLRAPCRTSQFAAILLKALHVQGLVPIMATSRAVCVSATRQPQRSRQVHPTLAASKARAVKRQVKNCLPQRS